MSNAMGFLVHNPFVLLFFAVGLSITVGKVSIKGYGLGPVAAAIIVGCGVAVLGAVLPCVFAFAIHIPV